MIAIIVPTLGRAHLLEPLAENIEEATKLPHQILFVVDEADTETREAVEALKAPQIVHDGTYPQKINAGIGATTEPFVILANDDLVFHAEWDVAAMECFTDEVSVVGPDDMSPATENQDNATMPIVRRSYIEDPGGAWGEFGVALHEGYHHVYSETELWQLADHRGVAMFCPDCVVEHCHPDWGKAEMDGTYQRGAYKTGAWDRDEQLFSKRRGLWQQS